MIKWDKIATLSKKKILAHQEKMLKELLQKKVPSVPAYHHWYTHDNIAYKRYSSLADFKKLPFTSRSDIVANTVSPAKPKEYVYAPSSKSLKEDAQITDLYLSAGTTGEPVEVFSSRADRATDAVVSSRIHSILGMNDHSQRMLTTLHPAIPLWQRAHRHLSGEFIGTHLGSGTAMPSSLLLTRMKQMQTDLLVGHPGYLYYLSTIAQAKNILSVKKLFVAGDVSKALRNRLRSAYHADVHSFYSFVEGRATWVESRPGHGYHLYPDLEYVEIIDPKTGELVSDGDAGEIVYTSLGWQGTTLIRYRTGDLCDGITWEKAENGMTTPRLMGVRRSQQEKECKVSSSRTLTLPHSYFSFLYDMPKVIDWQVAFSKKARVGTDEIYIYVACVQSDFAQLKKDIVDRVDQDHGVKVNVVYKATNVLHNSLGYERSLLCEKRFLNAKI